MKTIIFDGHAFAEEKEKVLQKKVYQLKKEGITPKLVTILVGDNPASKLFVEKKKKAAERIGCEVRIVKFHGKTSMMNDSLRLRIIRLIKELNLDNDVRGIMVQLPLPEGFSTKDREKIIDYIAKKKDVDGMRDDSLFLAPTIKAVICVLKEAIGLLPLKEAPCKVAVVGYSGFEGGKIYSTFKEMGYVVEGVNSKTKNFKEKTLLADILISATGSPGLIRGDMVKEGAIVIDVGAPKGDVVSDEVIGKAGFLSPVPGGVGPVTIVSLLENLVESCG